MALKSIYGAGPVKPKKQAYPSVTAGDLVPVNASTSPPAAGPDLSWQDSAYNANDSSITTGLNNLRGYLGNNAVGLGQGSGVSFDSNPSDANPLGAENFRIADNVDVTNPFSRAGLMKRSYQQAQRGNTTSMAARGQLYSGALQRAQDNSGFGFQQGQDALLKDFGSQYQGLLGQWLDANQSAAGQRSSNQSDALQRALALYRSRNEA